MKSICNFGYARAKLGRGQFNNVRGLLKYLQYRDDREDHIPGGGGPDRWIDGGLGANYQTILSRLDALSPANPNAYCFALVVSPDPRAIAQVEGDPQARFVEALQSSLADWEDWREDHDKRPQVGPLEYALVVHRPTREYGEQMHAHIIIAAATEDPLTGTRTPLYNNRPEIDQFTKTVWRELDRVYGLDPEIDRRQTPEPELEPAAPAKLSPAEFTPTQSTPPEDWEIPFHPTPAELSPTGFTPTEPLPTVEGDAE